MLEGVRTKVRIAPLNAARTAQRAVPTSRAPDTFNHTRSCRYKDNVDIFRHRKQTQCYSMAPVTG
jgi:hypothetical protein